MATPEESVATAEQVEMSPQGIVKRWIAEIDLASTNEEKWRGCADQIWELYRSENRKANSFNILWSNTETLRPALYNSTPRPDVRRRFRDPDPVGKVASNVLERSLVYSIDAYDFDFTIQETVLDVLLSGRGGARVKYMPKFRQVETPAEEMDGLGLEEPAAPQEELASEEVRCEHYDWCSFRHGPGKTWAEVPWVAFEHELPYSDLVKMFGAEIAAKIPLSEPTVDGKKNEKTYSKEVRTLLKTGHFWEVWDREKARVLFICEGYADQPLRVESDPLGLNEFFPLPRPIYAIEDSSSLIPQPLYEKYKPQAEELNRVTFRINKITDAMKVRGAYASNLAEIAKIIEASDNQMLPIENASAVAAMGGLDKAIWIMPIEKLAMVLKELYLSRDQTIKSIYEITGLGDIMRGVSNPHETLGAQELKSQWGTLRLQRLQREVQRFIRDLLRLKAEVMAEHFSQETFAAITGLQLPTNEQKALVQQAQAMAQQTQQEVPPEMQAQAQKILSSPTWEEVLELLKADGMRQYRIDIETDSTVQETLQRDAQGMQEAITAVVNLFAGVGPAIQSGILSVDVVKSIATAITRTSRMGQAVEDAIEQIQQPPPAPEEQAPPDHSLEVAQIKAQSDQQVTAAKLAAQKEIETGKAAADAQVKAAELQAQGQIEAVKADIAKQKQELDAQLAAQKAELDAAKVAAQEETKRMIAAVKEEGERERNVREHERAERDAQREEQRGQRDIETQKGIAENKTTIDALVKLVIAKMGGEQQDKDRDADAENAKMEKQEASAGRDNISSLLKKLVEASEKGSKPRKVKFEVGKDGLPSGATISSEE